MKNRASHHRFFRQLTSVLLLLFFSCDLENYMKPESEAEEGTTESFRNVNLREEMRRFVIDLSGYAKQKNSNFYVIPQNATGLITTNSLIKGPPHTAYLNAIDGNGKESLHYGFYADDEKTPQQETVTSTAFLNVSKSFGNAIFVVDYCSSPEKVSKSQQLNSDKGFVSFAANDRNLSTIPYNPKKTTNEKKTNASGIKLVEHVLYLLNKKNYTSKEDFIDAIHTTNYDMVIIDAFFNDATKYTKSDIDKLKTKPNGDTRLVIAYMSIGEAEDYRFYWKDSWYASEPSWLDVENADWPGNYRVKYWDTNWQNIIYGSPSSYLDKILTCGFDGVYLDVVDAFLHFEQYL